MSRINRYNRGGHRMPAEEVRPTKQPRQISQEMQDLLNDPVWGAQIRRGIVLDTTPFLLRKVLGKSMKPHFKDMKLAGRDKERVVIVTTDDVARQEIHAVREQLKDAINERVSTKLITEIEVK